MVFKLPPPITLLFPFALIVLFKPPNITEVVESVSFCCPPNMVVESPLLSLKVPPPIILWFTPIATFDQPPPIAEQGPPTLLNSPPRIVDPSFRKPPEVKIVFKQPPLITLYLPLLIILNRPPIKEDPSALVIVFWAPAPR